jgi:hypothetical protein
MADVHDVISKYIELIDDNVDDPNSARKDKGLKWIYDDVPMQTLSPGNYPRISVISTATSVAPHELNSMQQRINARIAVQIRTTRKSHGTYSPQAFNEWLSGQVRDVFSDEATVETLRDECQVFYPFLESESISYLDDLILRQLVYKNIMVRN